VAEVSQRLTVGYAHPQGSITAIKQEKGDEYILLWDIFLIKHARGYDRRIPLLTDQPPDDHYHVFGDDGVIMAGEG
jgi:hypothetical protein